MSTQLRTINRRDENGSRTEIATSTPVADAEGSLSDVDDQGRTVGVLRLRGGPIRRQQVVWAEDTVDNEGMGKKKSKICCIYHRPRAFDESSTESDSDTSDDMPSDNDRAQRGSSSKKREPATGNSKTGEESDSESEGGHGDGRARPSKPRRRKQRRHRHAEGCEHKHDDRPNKYDLPGKGSGDSANGGSSGSGKK